MTPEDRRRDRRHPRNTVRSAARSAAGCGPHDTMRDAAAPMRALDPEWKSAPIWRGHGPHEGWPRPTLTALSRALILDACEAAGVTLGAYDTEVVHWLAHQEPEICAVVAGLIQRGGQASVRGESP